MALSVDQKISEKIQYLNKLDKSLWISEERFLFWNFKVKFWANFEVEFILCLLLRFLPGFWRSILVPFLVSLNFGAFFESKIGIIFWNQILMSHFEVRFWGQIWKSDFGMIFWSHILESYLESDFGVIFWNNIFGQILGSYFTLIIEVSFSARIFGPSLSLHFEVRSLGQIWFKKVTFSICAQKF